MAIARVRADDLAVLVIDVQPRFLAGMAGEAEPVLARLEFLLALATAYDLPCLATFEEPTDRKGWLPARLEPFWPAHGRKLSKRTFDCCREGEGVPAALAALGRRQVAVAGSETDVCVLQSVLGLLALGQEVFLLEDALFSSEANVGPALRRMERAGAVPTTVKTLCYELRGSVAAPKLPDRLAERGLDLSLPEPEALPRWRAG